MDERTFCTASGQPCPVDILLTPVTRKYRNLKGNSQPKRILKYSEEWIQYRKLRGADSIKVAHCDTDDDGHFDAIVRAWRHPALKKSQICQTTPPFGPTNVVVAPLLPAFGPDNVVVAPLLPEFGPDNVVVAPTQIVVPGAPEGLNSVLTTDVPTEPVPGFGPVSGVAISQMNGATFYLDSGNNLMLLGQAFPLTDGGGNQIPPFRYYVPQLVDTSVSEIYSGMAYRGLAYKKNNELYHFDYSANSTVWRNPQVLDAGSNIIRYSQSGSVNSTLWVKSDNSLWAVGDNAWGVLLDGNPGVPIIQNTQVVASNVVDAAVGSTHGMYVTDTGDLFIAGNNAKGQLAQVQAVVKLDNPTITATNAVRCYAGLTNSYYIDNNDILWSCGEGTYGATGQTSRVDQFSWVQVATNVADVYPGRASCLFKKNDDTLWGCGSGLTLSTIGAGMEADHTPVQFATSVKSASAESASNTPSSAAFIFQKTDNSLWGWGYNNGRLGPQNGKDEWDGTTYNNPVTLKRSA